MPAFCIVPELAAQLKEAAKKGEITIQKLFDMSSSERRELFGKYTDKETATQINAGFEKAMASDQASVLNSWVKRTFTSKEREAGRAKDVIGKIQHLQEQGILTPKSEKAFLSDLVSTKLGATITADEAKNIAEKSAVLTSLKKEISGIGDPTENPKGQEAYLKAREDMTNYLLSLTPSSNIRVALGTIGRGMMVTTLHSPVLNVLAHSAITLPEAFARRIESRTFQGANTGFWWKYVKNSGRLFNKTGYDISRFEALGGEKKSMGEDYTHSQGPGITRWLGRVVEKTVFAHLHGDLYEKFAALHFADSANLQTTAIARAEGLRGQELSNRALELSKDAALIEPKTDLGRFIRAKAQADALYATFTNDSMAAKTALGLRTLANNATGDFRIGDVVVPFAKVPANALGTALDYAGVEATARLTSGLVKTIQGVAGGEPFDKANFAGMQRAFIRFGLGLTFASAISQLIKPQNFIGAYPSTNPSKQQLEALQNGVNNAVRIGNKWISLDYLGEDGAALLGMLYAKSYGSKTPLDWLYRYSQGTTQYLQNLPGLSEVAGLYKYLNTPPSQKDNVQTASVNAGKGILASITARIIPGIVSDIAKMTDYANRSTDKNSIFSQAQANIPGLREGLPIAHNLFGDSQGTEPAWQTLLFGSRVKTANDGKVLNELVNLNQQNALPTLTDVSKTSTVAQTLKSEIGPKQFDQAMQYFGKNLKQNFSDTMKSSDYTQASPLDKKTMLDKVKASTWKDTLSQYNYVKPAKK